MERFDKFKLPTIFAGFHWFIVTILQIDRIFCDYGNETKIYLFEKMLFLCFLIGIWNFAFFIYGEYKKGNENVKRGIQIFGVHFTLMMLMLLILWPGTWSWDDIIVLSRIRLYMWNSWQHILTSVIQLVFLQLFPVPGGIIFTQNLVISVIVSYTLVETERHFFHGKKICHFEIIDILIKLIPFLLPPLIILQFSGYRMGLYIYFELLLLCFFMCRAKEGEKWNLLVLVSVCILAAVVATWRTEGLFYVPVVCILLWLQNKNALSVKRKIAGIIIVVFCFFIINNVQSDALSRDSGHNYELLSTLSPCVEVVRNADKNEDADLLANIDKVVSIDAIYETDMRGEQLFWSGKGIRENYSDEDYNSYIKAFIKLALKYPKAVFRERWIVFVDVTGFKGMTNHATIIQQSAELFLETSTTYAKRFRSWDIPANEPPFKLARMLFIRLLGCSRSNWTVYPIYKIVWNSVIPIIFFVIAWAFLLVKKQWYHCIALSAVLIKVPIIILTQPAGVFMYFLTTYLFGYVALVYGIIWFINDRKRKTEREMR